MTVLFIVVITDGCCWCGGRQDVVPSVCLSVCLSAPLLCVSIHMPFLCLSLCVCVCDMFVVLSPDVHVVVCAFLSA